MDASQLPNPFTPLAWLPPELAYEFEICRHIGAITVGAWLWDIFSALPDEMKMFRKQRFRIPDMAYILARIGTGCFIWTTLIFNTATVRDCNALVKAIGWTGALSLPFNSLLFLIRLYAVFDRQKIVTTFFAALWIITAGCCMTAPFALSGTHIGTTNYCIFGRVRSFGSSGIVATAVNDTLVCTAITLQLVSSIPAASAAQRLKYMFSGKGMSKVARVVMHGGQLYYVITVGFTIAAATAILAPSVPESYGNVLAVPNVFLLNAMAARVYRQLKLGYLSDRPHESGPTNATLFTSRFSVNTTGTGLQVERDCIAVDDGSHFMGPDVIQLRIPPLDNTHKLQEAV